MEPKTFYFDDDGKIPNNALPLLFYQAAFDERGAHGASWLESTFAGHNWTNSWRNGVYPFHHYHSNTHEVLGIYSGSAELQLGGPKGAKMEVRAGDVIIIPAGVAHKNLGSTDLGVVGAYPNGRSHDMNRGREGERPKADKNIATVPVPSSDPLFGKKKGLVRIWN